MKRFELWSEFKPNSDVLEWLIVDTLKGVKVATIYVFDGTAQAIVDALNEMDAKEAVA